MLSKLVLQMRPNGRDIVPVPGSKWGRSNLTATNSMSVSGNHFEITAVEPKRIEITHLSKTTDGFWVKDGSDEKRTVKASSVFSLQNRDRYHFMGNAPNWGEHFLEAVRTGSSPSIPSSPVDSDHGEQGALPPGEEVYAELPVEDANPSPVGERIEGGVVEDLEEVPSEDEKEDENDQKKDYSEFSDMIEPDDFDKQEIAIVSRNLAKAFGSRVHEVDDSMLSERDQKFARMLRNKERPDFIRQMREKQAELLRAEPGSSRLQREKDMSPEPEDLVFARERKYRPIPMLERMKKDLAKKEQELRNKMSEKFHEDLDKEIRIKDVEEYVNDGERKTNHWSTIRVAKAPKPEGPGKKKAKTAHP